MNSNSQFQFELIKSLENLTFFPKHDICKQLDGHGLFLVSFFSENWEKFVKNHCGKAEKPVWEITLSKNVLMIYLKFKDAKKNFQIGFKEDPSSSEDFYFEHDRRWNCYTSYYKTAHKLEESSFKALELLSHLFPPLRYERITVPLGPRCPDFPFQFLSKLSRGISKYVDLQADQEVECVDLMTFLGNVRRIPPEGTLSYTMEKIKNRLDIKLRIKNLVPCDEISISHTNLILADARFLTHESIQKLDVVSAEIGKNNFTSKDFNAYLRAWMERKEDKKTDKITFKIREDQKIKIEEVMDGLNAHFGEPKIRDRWVLSLRIQMFRNIHEHLDPKAIECYQGWDIENNKGTLATVLLEPERLTFYSDLHCYTPEMYAKRVDSWGGAYRQSVCYRRMLMRDLETKIALQGANPRAEDLDKLIRLPEIIEEHTNGFRTVCEILDKLVYWKLISSFNTNNLRL